ncbi:MAG: hypothetical protein DDT41_01220 [candidate division WS2 bacterium]|nr:hypothetical protein [Candidatus Psychracetigena formicireducens]
MERLDDLKMLEKNIELQNKYPNVKSYWEAVYKACCPNNVADIIVKKCSVVEKVIPKKVIKEKAALHNIFYIIKRVDNDPKRYFVKFMGERSNIYNLLEDLTNEGKCAILSGAEMSGKKPKK